MTNPHEHSRIRRLGYQLLPGDLYSYLLHLRPREWPIVAAHMLFGFLLVIPLAASALERWPAALLGIFFFVILLNGGTLAINSAFDGDEGDIGYLDAPPPPPPHLFSFGIGLMAIGQIGSIMLLPAGFARVYAACFAMSILYSVPPFRWKAVAGLDLMINALGFGALTALAGWTLTEISPPTWALTILLAFAPLFAAFYPLTQFYQFDDDRERGDRTLALALGMKRSLLFSIFMVIVAFVMFGYGLLAGPAGHLWLLAAIPLIAWLRLLLRWLARHPTMTMEEHKDGMYSALRAWALTDALVLVAAVTPSLI